MSYTSHHAIVILGDPEKGYSEICCKYCGQFFSGNNQTLYGSHFHKHIEDSRDAMGSLGVCGGGTFSGGARPSPSKLLPRLMKSETELRVIRLWRDVRVKNDAMFERFNPIGKCINMRAFFIDQARCRKTFNMWRAFTLMRS